MKFIRRVFAVLLGIVIAFSLSHKPAAADVYIVDNPVLTGTFTSGSFDLSSEGVMFREGIRIVPGDELHTVIDIKNEMKVPMDIRLESLEIFESGNSFDQALTDAMQVEIKYNDEVLYRGAWKGTEQVQTKFITVPAGKTIQMQFNSWCPIETGNAAQNGKVETVWHFVAETEGEKSDAGISHKPIEEGVSDTPLELVMAVALIGIAVNLVFLLPNNKKKKDLICRKK